MSTRGASSRRKPVTTSSENESVAPIGITLKGRSSQRNTPTSQESTKNYIALPVLDLSTKSFSSFRGKGFDAPEWAEAIATLEEDEDLSAVVGICQWVGRYFTADFPFSDEGDILSYNREKLGPERCAAIRTSMLRIVHRILHFKPTWKEFVADTEHFELFLRNCREAQEAIPMENIYEPLGRLGFII